MSTPRFPTCKLLFFVLLSATDFALTRHLLATGGESVRETNLLAAWWLVRYGWVGLAGFKAAMMAVAAGLCVLIFFRRPAAGHRVLAFGCAALAAVVLYSGYLCDAQRRRPGGVDAAEAVSLRSESDRLDAGMGRSGAYRRAVDEVVRDLRSGRCTLEEGVARLAATEQARDAEWIRRFQLYYPGRTESECLAISLINSVDPVDAGPDEARQFGDDLRAEFRGLYGRPAPPPGPNGERLVASSPSVQ